MNVFILEDFPDRIEWLKKLFIGHNVTITETVDAAIEELKREGAGAEPFDMICLDHDLGGQIFVESGDNTGYAVAKAMCEDEIWEKQKRAFVYIHSCNPVGASKMQEVLKYKYKTLVFPATMMYSLYNGAL